MSLRTSALLVRLCLAASAVAGAVTYSAPAAAAPAFTLERATLGGGLRFGSEDLNLGLGARGGYTLDMGIYIGGLFDYWFGESDETSTIAGIGAESSYSAWDLMGVVGYDAGLTNSIVLRPYGGFGIVHADFEVCTTGPFIGQGCVDDSETDGGAVLGAEALFEISNGLHAGPEIRILIFEDTAFVIGGNIGGTF